MQLMQFLPVPPAHPCLSSQRPTCIQCLDKDIESLLLLHLSSTPIFFIKSPSLNPCTLSYYAVITVFNSYTVNATWKKICKVRIILSTVPQLFKTFKTWQTIHTHHTRWPSSAQGSVWADHYQQVQAVTTVTIHIYIYYYYYIII